MKDSCLINSSIIICNGYLVLERIKSKSNTETIGGFQFVTPVHSNNLGLVLGVGSESLSHLLNKKVYFKTPYEQLLFEGREVVVIKEDSIVGVFINEENQK